MNYLRIDGKLAFNNGKLIPIDGSGTSEDVTDLVNEQITYVDQSTELTNEIESLVDNLKVENPQEKTITPSTNAQVITPDEGYTCLSKVTVEGVESTNPVEISTEAEMDALLTADNVGKIYKFVGNNGKYITNAIYIVEEN